MITDICPVDICTDCTIWHANGDTTGISDLIEEETVRAAPGVPAGWHVSPGHIHTLEECGEDVVEGYADCPYDEGHFSMTPCDACRRPLGGDRYPAAFIGTFEP